MENAVTVWKDTRRTGKDAKGVGVNRNGAFAEYLCDSVK